MRILFYACLVFSSCALPCWGTQGVDCKPISALAQMAGARSNAALVRAKTQAGETYRAQLVFAYRSFQLVPDSKHAAKLLAMLPKDDAQQTVVMTLGDGLCSGETDADQLTLSHVGEGLARELARAVILAPQYLPAYVEHAMEAARDPHSDYAERMVKVCQQKHVPFLHAVQQLPRDRQQQFAKYVLEPTSCRAIAIPEAD